MTPQTLKTVRAYALLNDDDNESALPQDDMLVMPDQISYDKEKLTITIGGVTFRSKNPRLTFARALSAFEDDAQFDNHVNGVLVSDNTQGDQFIAGAYCVIGGDGFGYATDEKGEHIHIPHFGRIVIEENVSVHNFVNIDRGVIGDTIIRKGVKIDSFTHVAHGVEIGQNTLVAAHTIIGGSAVIGENCYLGIGCIIKNKVKIGKNSIIGAGCVVLKDVEENSVMVGNPARLLRKNV